jgi:Na+/H+ antiporter NhaD/arsenite permease-like protein
MLTAAILIFVLVYLGMILGNWPGFALDRTGIALLGAIAFIWLQDLSINKAASYIDLSALAILFSFMIISAQFYYSGFYTYVIEKMERWTLSPSILLLVIIFLSAGLSAVLINDIVCLALTPLIIRVCLRKALNPIPYLLGLACASNIGSAITLIGNPQNLLIGQVLSIPFGEYLKYSLVPCLIGLGVTWLIIHYTTKQWSGQRAETDPETIPFDLWQSWKGVIVIVILLLLFLFTDLPRDKTSLIAAGFILLSRRMASQTMLSFIDWQLLVLFIGLFIVNRSFLSIPEITSYTQTLTSSYLNLESPSILVTVSVVLSNLVSNVPAVMLLLPFIHSTFSGILLALSSTLAGNLFIVGSIANLIVIAQAMKYGIKINWKQHIVIGLPVTIVTILLMLGWVYLIQGSL